MVPVFKLGVCLSVRLNIVDLWQVSICVLQVLRCGVVVWRCCGVEVLWCGDVMAWRCSDSDVEVLCMLYKIRCNPMHTLYGMGQCGLHGVLW